MASTEKKFDADFAVSHVDNVRDSSSGDQIAEHVQYGQGGILSVLKQPYMLGAALLASTGGFSWGYDQGVISIINVMPQFHEAYPRLDPDSSAHAFWSGFMTGMLEFGAFLGCFFMPWLADKISRKRALSFVSVIFVIGAIMQTAAPDYAVLVAGRTITGVGVGTLAMGAPLYISEISPPQVRGALLVLEAVSVVFGIVIAFWMTYGTQYISGEASSRLPFGLQIVPAIIIGVGINFFPYSPRWLALVGRNEEALRSLARLRSLPTTDECVLAEYRGIVTEVRFQQLAVEKAHPGKSGFKLELLRWLDLFKRKSWRRTAIGLGVTFFQQFSGINAFIYYSPTLFTALGQKDRALILAGVLNIAQLIAILIAFLIIEHVGRRRLAVWGGFSMGVPYVIIAALYGLYSSDWAAHQSAGWACVAMAFVFIMVYGVSYAPLGWTLPAEVFSNAQRSKGVTLATSTLWLWNFIVGVAVPPMIQDAGFGTYVFFACFCFLSGVWAYFLVPETKGKTLEELDKVFNDGTGVEEMEMMREAVATTQGEMRQGTLHA